MRKPILFVNACVRKESRTIKLAGELLSKMDEPYEELRLGEMTFFVVNEENFAEVKKQFPQSERQHLAQFGSRRHKDLFLCAEKVITAFIERENYQSDNYPRRG